MPALGNALGLPYRKNGLGFVGALDAYLTSLVAVYSVNAKLVANYNGSAIRARRSSDNTLTDIPFLSNGNFDAASYLAFIGGGSGFAHTIYDQSGNGRHQVQSTAAAQPQIGVDGNGQYYLYAPGSGSGTTSMSCTGLSIAAPEFTIWHVAGTPGYWFTPICLRDATAAKERAVYNAGANLVPNLQDNATGTVPTNIGVTAGSVYSVLMSAGASGCKMTNRLSTTTGTRNASACNIEQIHLGRISGGASWLQNAPFYIAAVWNVDKGPTADFAALATLGKTLIPAAQ